MLFAALVAANFVLLCVAAAAGRSLHWGRFRSSVANPAYFFVLLGSVSAVDFVFLYVDGSVTMFEINRQLSREMVEDAFAIYTAYLAASVAALCAAVWSFPPPRPQQPAIECPLAARLSLVVTYGPALTATAAIVAALPAILSGSINRQLLFLSNPLLLLGVGAVAPGLALHLATIERTRARDLALTGVAILLILATGSRGSVFLIGLILAIALVNDGRRVPAWLYIPALPFGLAILTILRFVFRESWRYDSVSDFVKAHGGIGRLYFGGSEIGFADSFTLIVHDIERLARPAFEGFLGILLYPIPRSVVPFKPISASAHLTEMYSPRKWALTRSEVLATGFGDLTMQFGYIVAPLVVATLTFLWARACVRTCNGGRFASTFALPFLVYSFYIAHRGAFFNLGALVWPLAVTFAVYLVLKNLLASQPLAAYSSERLP